MLKRRVQCSDFLLVANCSRNVTVTDAPRARVSQAKNKHMHSQPFPACCRWMPLRSRRATVAKLLRFLGWRAGSQPALVGTHVYSGNTVAAYSFAWFPVHAAHLFGQCASQDNVSSQVGQQALAHTQGAQPSCLCN